MKYLALLLVTLLPLAGARAGEVFGTISENSKPVAAGMKVEITVASKTYTATTDKFGSYRIFVKEKGKASFSVYASDQSASAELFSYEKATRYDWILEVKEGKLSLRRR